VKEWCGLTRGQKLISPPIDFFSTRQNAVCICSKLLIVIRLIYITNRIFLNLLKQLVAFSCKEHMPKYIGHMPHQLMMYVCCWIQEEDWMIWSAGLKKEAWGHGALWKLEFSCSRALKNVICWHQLVKGFSFAHKHSFWLYPIPSIDDYSWSWNCKFSLCFRYLKFWENTVIVCNHARLALTSLIVRGTVDESLVCVLVCNQLDYFFHHSMKYSLCPQIKYLYWLLVWKFGWPPKIRWPPGDLPKKTSTD